MSKDVFFGRKERSVGDLRSAFRRGQETLAERKTEPRAERKAEPRAERRTETLAERKMANLFPSGIHLAPWSRSRWRNDPVTILPNYGTWRRSDASNL